MNKYSLDYSKLEKTLTKKKSYLLEDVKDRIEKVAWDVVRFRDNNDVDTLWKVEDSPDGPIIVALYDDSSGQLISKEASSSDWEIVKKANDLHVFYKNEPITILKSNKLGIPENEMDLVARWLPEKLASDEDYQAYILSFAGKENLSLFVNSYPELAKVASKAIAIESGAAFEQNKDLLEIAELITRN